MDNDSMTQNVDIMKNIKAEPPISPSEDDTKDTKKILSAIDPKILCAICSEKISKLAGKKQKDAIMDHKPPVTMSSAEIAIQTDEYTWLQVRHDFSFIRNSYKGDW